MAGIIELEDKELEKVVGGVSDTDISNVVSILQQISNMISNSKLEDYKKSKMNEYIDTLLFYLDNRDFIAARQEYNKLMDDINQSLINHPDLFPANFTDAIDEFLQLMGSIN